MGVGSVPYAVPEVSSFDDGFTLPPVASYVRIYLPSTVTVHEALFPSAVAVIVAVPADLAVTVPLLTVATLGLLELHDTVLLVAFEGVTVALSVAVSPSVSEILELLRITLVTLIVTGWTSTVQYAFLPPAVAVIVAVPTDFAVTVPLLTVATLVLLELHDTVLFVAFDGLTVAVSVAVQPAVR